MVQPATMVDQNWQKARNEPGVKLDEALSILWREDRG